MRTSRLVSVLLAGALLVAACGDDDDEASAGDETPAEGSSAGDSASCDDSDPIKIGVTVALSGPTAQSGEWSLDGVEMAVEEINAGESDVFDLSGPGILGRCVEVIEGDDQNDPTTAAQVGSRLVDQDEVDMVVGSFSSGSVGATLPITQQAGVLHAVANTAPIDYADAPYAFRLEATSAQLAPSMAAFIESRGWSKVGVMALNNTFGTALLDEFEGVASEAGIEITGSELFESGAVDVAPQLRSLQDGDPEAVMLFAFGVDAANTISSRNSLGWDVPMIGSTGAAFTDVIDAVGVDGMNEVYAAGYLADTTHEEGADRPIGDKAAAFVDRYKEYLGVETLDIGISQASVFYDSVHLLAQGINAAGELDAEAATAALISSGFEGVRAAYSFEEDDRDGVPQEAVVTVVAASLEDGTLQNAME